MELGSRIDNQLFAIFITLVTFSVSHKKKGEGASEKTEYTAEFLSPLDVASWHKVNLSVKGTSFEAESHDLQLMSNQGN